METKILQDKPSDWNNIVHHPLQSWEWGEFRKKTGVDVVRIGIFNSQPATHNPKLVDGWQLTFHKLPKLPFTIGYFPKGPLPTHLMTEELKKIAKEKNAIFIQLEPNIQKTNNQQLTTHNQLVPSHHPLFTKYTFILDLAKTEDQLLKDMHNKTRYNIKVAEKHEVVIKEDSSDQGFEEYLKLTRETTERQGFFAHTESYHRKMWNTLHPQGIARLWNASYQGKTLASWILFCWQDTLYYPYGASSREFRNVMAPNLLLWQIVKWAKAHGFKKFDLWGAIGPEPNETDPFYGFHRFKQGYNPELVEFIGSYDLIINPSLYKAYCLADTIRWKILKRK